MRGAAEREAVLRTILTLDPSDIGVERVRCALTSGEPQDQHLLRTVARFRLDPLLFYYLRRHALVDALPGAQSQWLRAEFTRAGLKAAVLRQAALELTGGLAEAGIRVMWIKGLWLGRAVYEHAALRPMDDCDLLLPRAAFADGEAVVRRLGFEPAAFDTMFGAESHASQFERPWPTGEKDRRVSLDLHREVFPPDECDWCTDLAWQTARPVEEKGTRFFEPSPEFGLIVTALHLFRHAMNPKFRFAGVADAAALFRRYGSTLDWGWLRDVAARPRVTASLYLLLRSCGESIPAGEPLEFLRSLDADVSRWGLHPKFDRLLAAASSVPPVRKSDPNLSKHLRPGPLWKALPAMVASGLSRRREFLFQVAAERGENPRQPAGVLRMLLGLARTNWRYARASYLLGRLKSELDQVVRRP